MKFDAGHISLLLGPILVALGNAMVQNWSQASVGALIMAVGGVPPALGLAFKRSVLDAPKETPKP